MRGFRAWFRDPPGGCPHYMDLGPRIQPNLTHICADSECSRSVFAQICLQLWLLGTPSPFLPRNCGHFPCPLPSLTHKVSSTFRDSETISPAKDGKALQAPAHVQVPAPQGLSSLYARGPPGFVGSEYVRALESGSITGLQDGVLNGLAMSHKHTLSLSPGDFSGLPCP